MPELKLIVGDRNTSAESLPPYLALAHTGAPFERERGDAAPSLDGVSGALAICEHLARRFPAARLWPKDEATLADARALATQRWPALEREVPFLFLGKKPAPKLSAEAQRELDALKAAWAASRKKYERVGPWLTGAFSIADCMAAPFASRAMTWSLPLDAAYVEAIFALPAMKRWGEAAALDVRES